MSKADKETLRRLRKQLKVFYPHGKQESTLRGAPLKNVYSFSEAGAERYLLALGKENTSLSQSVLEKLEPGDRILVARQNVSGVFEARLDDDVIASLKNAKPSRINGKFQLSSGLLAEGKLTLKTKKATLEIPVKALKSSPELPKAWKDALGRIRSSKRKPFYMPGALLIVLDWSLDKTGSLKVPYGEFKEKFLTLVEAADPGGKHDARMPFFHLSQGAQFWTLSGGQKTSFTDASQIHNETMAQLPEDLASALKDEVTKGSIRTEVYELCPASLAAVHRYRWSEGRRAISAFVKSCEQMLEIYPKESTRGKISKDCQSWALKEEVKNEIQVLSQQLVPSLYWEGVASVGLGNWASIPWFAVLDTRVTQSAQNGVYPVGHFIFEDGKAWLRLGLGVSATEYGAKAGDKAEEVFQQLDSWSGREFEEFGLREQQSLVKGSGKIGRHFNAGMVAEKLFAAESLSDAHSEIAGTWRLILTAYLTWVEKGRAKPIDPKPVAEMIESLDDAIQKLKEKARIRGLIYSDQILEAFLLSLKTKPFCLLVGPTGTGKSRLARLLGDIGAQVTVVPVEPSWTDGTPIIGYRDLNHSFRPGVLAKIAQEAEDDPSRLHVLVLDELNLARVEHYLATWLSVLESRTIVGETVEADALYQDESLSIPYPSNLVVVGTVNMDESTFVFSQRVLDRANALPLPSPMSLLTESSSEAPEEKDEALVLSPKVLSPRALTWSDLMKESSAEGAGEIERAVKDYLQATQNALHKHGSRARISFRLRDEICAYILHGLESNLGKSLEQFMDQQLKQRLLPKLCDGSDRLTQELVDDLQSAWQGLPDEPGSARQLLLRVQKLERRYDMPVSLWTALA